MERRKRSNAEEILQTYKRKLNKAYKTGKLKKEECLILVRKREIELGLRQPENHNLHIHSLDEEKIDENNVKEISDNKFDSIESKDDVDLINEHHEKSFDAEEIDAKSDSTEEEKNYELNKRDYKSTKKSRKKGVVISAVLISIILVAFLLFADIDGDGLIGLSELKNGTDMFNEDTDGDGLDDKTEIEIHSTDPLKDDTDDDGLNDYDEINTYNTNPINPHSDEDNIQDGDEITRGTNPSDPDTDGDGLFDSEAFPNDISLPTLVLNATSLNPVRSNKIEFAVGYAIQSPDCVFQNSWIYDENLVESRINWNTFSIQLNGHTMSYEKSSGNKVTFQTSNKGILNIKVTTPESQIQKSYEVTKPSYTFTEISSYWDTHAISEENLKSQRNGSMQYVFDDYAIAISSLELLKKEIDALVSGITDYSLYLDLLSDTYFRSSSKTDFVDSLMNVIEENENVNEMRESAEYVWLGVNGLASFPVNDFVQSYIQGTGYPHVNEELADVTLDAIINYLSGGIIPTNPSNHIDTVIDALKGIHIGLAREYFSWIEDNTHIKSNENKAHMAEWYLDNIWRVQGLGKTYGTVTNYEHGFWTPEKNGETTIAWMPASYAWTLSDRSMLAYTPYEMSDSDTTTQLEKGDFPITWTSYGETTEKTYDAFYCTKDLAREYMEENGLGVKHLPPTSSENSKFSGMRKVAKYMEKEKSNSDVVMIFLSAEVENEIDWLANAFENFDTTSNALVVSRSYGYVSSFINSINANSIRIREI